MRVNGPIISTVKFCLLSFFAFNKIKKFSRVTSKSQFKKKKKKHVKVTKKIEKKEQEKWV